MSPQLHHNCFQIFVPSTAFFRLGDCLFVYSVQRFLVPLPTKLYHAFLNVCWTVQNNCSDLWSLPSDSYQSFCQIWNQFLIGFHFLIPLLRLDFIFWSRSYECLWTTSFFIRFSFVYIQFTIACIILYRKLWSLGLTTVSDYDNGCQCCLKIRTIAFCSHFSAVHLHEMSCNEFVNCFKMMGKNYSETLNEKVPYSKFVFERIIFVPSLVVVITNWKSNALDSHTKTITLLFCLD